MKNLNMTEAADELDNVIAHLRVLQAAVSNPAFNEISQSEGMVLEEIIERLEEINNYLQAEE